MEEQKNTPSGPSYAAELMAHPDEGVYSLTEALIDGAMKDNDACREVLCALAKHSMEKLVVLSMADDKQAIECLINTMRNTLDRIEDEWEKSPQNYVPLARASDRWPCLFYYRKPDRKQTHDFVVDTLQLSQSFPLDLSRGFDATTIGTAIALELFNRMDNIEQLPPLSTDTAKIWWDAAEPVFFKLFGEEFQDHPVFEEFQKNSAYKDLDPPQKRTAMRYQIIDRVKQSFESIGHKRPSLQPPLAP
jgi:hypothetical protein